MKYLKHRLVLIVGFLVCFTSIQSLSQPTATAAEIKQVQDVLDEMKKLKDGGKRDNDPAIIELAKKAIHLADSFYKVTAPGNVVGGEAQYDPEVRGEGVARQIGDKVRVRVGPKAFTSPGWLISTKIHEFLHASQASDGRWPPVPVVPERFEDIPGATMEEKLKFLEELEAKLKKLTKSSSINEVEAYDEEIKKAAETGLDSAELAEVQSRRRSHFNKLDSANKAKIDQAKTNGETYKTVMLPSSGRSMAALTRNSELFVSGNVLAEERMLVTFRGSQVVEGNVVTAEIDGKTVDARTNSQGKAFLDMSAIATGITSATTAIIRITDPKGRAISTTTTSVEPGSPMIFNQPEMISLPANLPCNDVVTIPGNNLGAESNLVIGEQFQETLSASDREMTVFTDSKTGTQPAFVVTSSGVSQSQAVNMYALNFSLPQNSITPKEVVAAKLSYESIPEGTKLVFTNGSPQTVTMAIPGGECSGNRCIVTVSNNNGTIPVNITGKTRGNFKIGVEPQFNNSNQR